MHNFFTLAALLLQLVHGVHGRSFDRDLIHAGVKYGDDFIFERDDGDSAPFATKCSPPTHPAPSRRDVYFDTSEDSAQNVSTQLWRRVMTLPEGNDVASMNTFMLREIGTSTTGVVWTTREGDDQNTAIYQLLSGTAVSAAMRGLSGCSSLVIVSRTAYYVSHYWETISFDPDLEKWKFKDADDALTRSVLTPLREGDGGRTNPAQYSLDKAKGSFSDNSVRAFIIGPDKNSDGKRVGYPDQWGKIKNTVGSIVPGLNPDQHPDRWTEKRYRRVEDDNSALSTTATGRVLIKYDPDHPERSGQKKLSLWVERDQVYDDTW